MIPSPTQSYVRATPTPPSHPLSPPSLRYLLNTQADTVLPLPIRTPPSSEGVFNEAYAINLDMIPPVNSEQQLCCDPTEYTYPRNFTDNQDTDERYQSSIHIFNSCEHAIESGETELSPEPQLHIGDQTPKNTIRCIFTATRVLSKCIGQ